MTDRAAPGAQGSTVRNMEYGEMGGAPAPFIVPYHVGPSRAAQRWDNLDDPATVAESVWAENDAFGYIQETSEDYIRLNPGEGYVDGWFATDAEKTVDISSYQQEEVVIVVGWDPDAVYSSDIHDTREDADVVFADVERNVSDDVPYIPVYRGNVVQHSDGGFLLQDGDAFDLRPMGRPVEMLPSNEPFTDNGVDVTKGPGVNLLRGRPTTFTGGVSTGPQEAHVNALRAIFEQAPVNADATQGDTSILTLLQSAGLPAMYMERILDGQGGAYGHQLQAPLGLFSRINANLDWEYNALSDVPTWTSADGGVSVWTTNINGRPRRFHVEHDGSAGSNDFGGAMADVLTTFESVGAFRITFHDVSFTENNASNRFGVGVSTIADASVDMTSNGDGITLTADAGSNDYTINAINAGTSSTASYNGPDWTTNHDLSIEYDGAEVRGYVDGDFIGSVAHAVNADYRPIFQLMDSGGVTEAETAEVAEVSVEPLPEVMN